MQVIRTFTLGAALVLGATTIAAAQQPATNQPPREARTHARPHDARGPQRERAMRGRAEGSALLRGIQLSEAQREQARAIGEKYRPQMRELMRSARPERAERTQTRPDSAERARMRAQAQERMRTIRPQMEALRQQQEGELRAILTPEQQQTFDANRAQRAERAEQMKDSGRRPGRTRPPA